MKHHPDEGTNRAAALAAEAELLANQLLVLVRDLKVELIEERGDGAVTNE